MISNKGSGTKIGFADPLVAAKPAIEDAISQMAQANPEEPPPPPDTTSAEEAAMEALKQQVGKKGKASTILTPSYGFESTPSSKKVLLGA